MEATYHLSFIANLFGALVFGVLSLFGTVKKYLDTTASKFSALLFRHSDPDPYQHELEHFLVPLSKWAKEQWCLLNFLLSVVENKVVTFSRVLWMEMRFSLGVMKSQPAVDQEKVQWLTSTVDHQNWRKKKNASLNSEIIEFFIFQNFEFFRYFWHKNVKHVIITIKIQN